ncbi:small T antigen [LI polyomavirus]|uniref:Small T antigen n=1 Tax=LI polyomavirus TaxID=1965344 RepID=A0A1U9VWX0_9POLY|nr:small T antigen [LI polyomavirus]AQX36242.1 small T antigen [LI polyomavirus]DBA09030.1 TPA_asm: small t [Cat associated lyon-IARC polyomavirus]
MDAVLTTPERRQLCLLLDISPQEYGNIPLMKNAFKKACLKHHPDKGGDPVLMMQLNSLWGKFTTSLTEARASTYQASTLFWEIDNPLKNLLGPVIKRPFLKSPHCINSKFYNCRCIVCSLSDQHSSLKILQKKKCLIWGECYCYYCFVTWFGLPGNSATFEDYKNLILEMDVDLLNLHC